MTLDNMTGITEGSYTGFCKRQLITCNRVKECNGVCPFEDALKHADKEMDEQTVKEEHDITNEWIPCSERLPKEKARVLTYDTMGDVVFGQYDKGKWYWEAEACADYWAKNDGVIAWMPLPKPYKGGDSE